MRFVLLLRGVNVGGRNKVDMPDLKRQLERRGFSDAETYLNSGNILLHAELCRNEAAQHVLDVLRKNYEFDIPFALLTADMLQEDMQTIPPWWSEPFARKDALFPTEGADFDAVKADIAAMPPGDEIIHFARHVILWGKRDESTYNRTAYHRLLIRKPYYRELTIRGGNTFDQIMKRIK